MHGYGIYRATIKYQQSNGMDQRMNENCYVIKSLSDDI